MAIIPTTSRACAKKKLRNSFLTAKFYKCGKNKHDVFNAQEKGMLKAELMKWLFRFGIIKLRLQLRYQRMTGAYKQEHASPHYFCHGAFID